MKHLESLAAMRATSRKWRRDGRSIGLVPTMGALHEGHLSLVHAAREHCDAIVVSVFVNPMQFGPTEDLNRYPRDLEGDAAKLASLRVDALFTTTPAEMYPDGFQTRVEPGGLSEPLCGASRPGHFPGVTTVVTKLFHLVAPHHAYFGQKDFQQARVLEQMVEDLNFDLVMHLVPTVREADGLAMSSRNLLLSPTEREVAPSLYAALCAVRGAFDAGERNRTRLVQAGRDSLGQVSAMRVDYLEVRDDRTLQEVDVLEDSGVAAAAAFLGSTRLIDNVLLGEAARRLR